MPIGSLLQGREQQYVANQDDKGTWRVLDTWHEALKNMQPDDDIEDDNPAITILTEGAFIALVKEAARTGTLENANFQVEAAEVDDTLVNELRQQINELTVELNSEKQNVVLSKKSLKETAMEHVVRLAAMDDMNSLSQ